MSNVDIDQLPLEDLIHYARFYKFDRKNQTLIQFIETENKLKRLLKQHGYLMHPGCCGQYTIEKYDLQK